MAPTILIKFCEFIVYSKPNNMTYRLFPEKSLNLEKQFLIFCPSPDVVLEPTDQSSSHSTSRVPLQISLTFFFDLPSKLRVVHMRKNLNFSFSQKWLLRFSSAHSTILLLLHLRHKHFTYLIAHSLTLPPLHLRHSSFYNPSAASPTSQVILQPFRCFT